MTDNAQKKKLDRGVYPELERVQSEIKHVLIMARLRNLCKEIDVVFKINGEEQ